MPDNFPEGEGPITDAKAAKDRARLDRQRPEHAYRKGPEERDLRDKVGDADLEDPDKQEDLDE